MKDLYYIGEVAEILNISTQTLRYYDKIGVLQPAYTDPDTGYRKYTYDQISYADRIRHLQTLGLNLEEIQNAIQENSVEHLSAMLEKKRSQTQEEIKRLKGLEKDLAWFSAYYNHIPLTGGMLELPFLQHFEERYVLAEPISESEGSYGVGHKLLRRKNSRQFNKLNYRRQNGYTLNYEKFVSGIMQPESYFMLLRGTPDFENKYILRFPAGNYLCMRTRLLSDPIPVETIQKYTTGLSGTPLMIAWEYEDNFSDFLLCPYDLQILFHEDSAANV